MHLDALLDLDVVALEGDDTVTILLELAAPAPPVKHDRPPQTLQVVLDRSGSMSGDRLEAAKSALIALIGKLDPADRLGVVCFDDEVTVAVPAGPLTDKDAARDAVARIWPGGMTNLSGGLLRGLQEADRVRGDGGATVLLLSDGHANQGVTGHEALQGVAAAARGRGITVSTIGLGLDYDEALLAAIAAGGAGNAHFAEGADEAGPLVASEVDGLLEQVAQAASLVVRPTGAVSQVTLFNDLPTTTVEGGFMVELGDFLSGETRKVLLEAAIPAMPGLGLAQVCELELRWTDVATLMSHTVTVPVHVNVVPGDAAAGRIPDAKVVSERAYQEAQKAKRAAADALRRGDHDAAAQHYDAAGGSIAAAMACAPPAMAGDLGDEAELLRELSRRAKVDDARRLAKFTEADRHRKARRRGRG